MAQVSHRRFYNIVLHALALPQHRLSIAQEPQTKLRPNESTTLTLNPLRVDRASA